MIKLCIDDQKVDALVDTGSDYSLIGNTFLNMFPYLTEKE